MTAKSSKAIMQTRQRQRRVYERYNKGDARRQRVAKTLEFRTHGEQ